MGHLSLAEAMTSDQGANHPRIKGRPCLRGRGRPMSRLSPSQNDGKFVSGIGLSSLAGGRATRHLISGGDGGFGAGTGQDTLGFREAFLGIGSFHFDPHHDLSLMESVQIMLADSFAISIGQDEIAEPAGNGAASYQD